MRDILGNEFDVGDRVIFSRPKYRRYRTHSIGRGVVEKITDTRISIKLDGGFIGHGMNFAILTKNEEHFLREDSIWGL